MGRTLLGPHRGDNVAQLLIETIQTYNLAQRLGFCVLGNAGDNDTSLRSVEAYLLTQRV